MVSKVLLSVLFTGCDVPAHAVPAPDLRSYLGDHARVKHQNLRRGLSPGTSPLVGKNMPHLGSWWPQTNLGHAQLEAPQAQIFFARKYVASKQIVADPWGPLHFYKTKSVTHLPYFWNICTSPIYNIDCTTYLHSRECILYQCR